MWGWVISYFLTGYLYFEYVRIMTKATHRKNPDTFVERRWSVGNVGMILLCWPFWVGFKTWMIALKSPKRGLSKLTTVVVEAAVPASTYVGIMLLLDYV